MATGIVMVEITPHPFFRRDGSDHIRMDLPITLDEAVNGGKGQGAPRSTAPVMLTLKPGANGGSVSCG